MAQFWISFSLLLLLLTWDVYYCVDLGSKYWMAPMKDCIALQQAPIENETPHFLFEIEQCVLRTIGLR